MQKRYALSASIVLLGAAIGVGQPLTVAWKRRGLEEERQKLALQIAQQAPRVADAAAKEVELRLLAGPDTPVQLPPNLQAVVGAQALTAGRYRQVGSEISSLPESWFELPAVGFLTTVPPPPPPLNPEDILLQEVATLVRMPLPLTRIVPRPTGRDCENEHKVRRKIKPDQYFKFYEKDWTLKGSVGKAISGEVGIKEQFVTGLDAFLNSQLVGARLVIDAYKTDCGLSGDVLVALGDRTARLGGAVYIVLARFQRGQEAAAAARNARTEEEKKQAEQKLESSRQEIVRGAVTLLAP